MLQRLAFDDLHHDEGVAFVVANVVERADVGMVEPRDGPGLAFETLTRGLILSDVWREDFDGDRPSEAGVRGSVHLAHSTGANGADDFIRTESSAAGRDMVF